jgi:ubiquinone/menaquinone biosynthesis C-methylase UbiE
MKFGIQAENPLEWLLIWIAEKANLLPMPLFHGAVGEINANVVYAAFNLGIFEAAKDSPQTLEEIAQKTGLNAHSLSGVMMVLILLRYFKYKNNKFALTPAARLFCLKESKADIYDYTVFMGIMAGWTGQLEEYLKTGKGIKVHETMNGEEWRLYQLNMEYQAKATSKQAPKFTPMLPNPTAMLDIGGSHGLYCVEMCKKYPTLKATILDLPQAVEKARPLLAKDNMGDRVCYRPGNACIDDFGENKYDLILMSHLMHHLSPEQNTLVCDKAARALKPGGYFVVQEFIRPEFSDNLNSMLKATGLYGNLIFNISSESGTFKREEIEEYQKKAGLKPCGVNKFKGSMVSSFEQVCAKKV